MQNFTSYITSEGIHTAISTEHWLVKHTHTQNKHTHTHTQSCTTPTRQFKRAVPSHHAAACRCPFLHHAYLLHVCVLPTTTLLCTALPRTLLCTALPTATLPHATTLPDATTITLPVCTAAPVQLIPQPPIVPLILLLLLLLLHLPFPIHPRTLAHRHAPFSRAILWPILHTIL